MEHEELTRRIIGCAMKVHGHLGPGFLEMVYQNALVHEIKKEGLEVECEKRLQVIYDGIIVGDYYADMVIDGCVLVENKAVQTLASAHEAQLVNYLTATGIEIGLLLNFGASRLEFKRKTRIYQPSKSRQDEQELQDKSQTNIVSHPVYPVHPVGKNSFRQDVQDCQDKSQACFVSHPVHPVNPVEKVLLRQDERDLRDENPALSSVLHPANLVHPF